MTLALVRDYGAAGVAAGALVVLFGGAAGVPAADFLYDALSYDFGDYLKDAFNPGALPMPFEKQVPVEPGLFRA